jgi:D-glycero-alpha-D-manno-heptose 1-phosphate guanylyltransferase
MIQSKPSIKTSASSSQVRVGLILAGGLGTRLRSSVPDLPKCMAPVAGRPFLFYVINYLRTQGIEQFIFSLGYKHEIIETWLADHFPALDYQCVIEAEPLGTGGAIHLACKHTEQENIIVTNGDTLFKVNIASLTTSHFESGAECSLALKPMEQFDRYGAVEIGEGGSVQAFREKQFYTRGLINGGVYVLNLKRFLARPFPNKFSFEKDYLEKQSGSGKIAGQAQPGYFIDIGIPEDFNRAQAELKSAPLDLKRIDKHWTLFLDRDGVINEDKPGSYIFSPEEFVFMRGGAGIFKKLTDRFGHIIVATNQRGVGRGLMTEETLTAIHQKMSGDVVRAGGRIDAIYYATAINNKDPFRKPNPGMAVRARSEFPDIDLSRSIMVGNNLSDMQFGRNAGMYTVFVSTTNRELRLPHPDIDLMFDSLEDFTKAL